MIVIDCTSEVETLCRVWAERLALPTSNLYVTTSKQRFESWLGRRVNGSIGGGYAWSSRQGRHLVFINLGRIDREQPKSLDVVVCEELLHMRHRLDGDTRRHAKHGYDRIAHQVSELTGASLVEVRAALLPVERRPYRYRYECPECRRSVLRRKQGTWSCGLCRPTFSPAHVLRLVEVLSPQVEASQGRYD